METHNHTTIRPVTVGYVLSVFRDAHRQVSRFDACCDRSIDLTLQSTVAEWRCAMDLMDTLGLGHGMNVMWQINCSEAEWESVLHPPTQRTLRDVAELISKYSMRREICPSDIAGSRCLPAAAFLTIKEYLAVDGVDVSQIAPSTPLGDLVRANLNVFLGPISRLAPGALPDIDVVMPEDSVSITLGVVQLGLWLFAIVVWLAGGDWTPLMITAAFLALLVFVASLFQKPPQLISATFGELRTFRELSECIAAGVKNGVAAE